MDNNIFCFDKIHVLFKEIYDNVFCFYKIRIFFIITILFLLVLACLLLPSDFFKFSQQDIFDYNQVPKKESPDDISLSRVIYLITCATQTEVDTHLLLTSLPNPSADVIFYCWGENCVDTFIERRMKVQFAVKEWKPLNSEDEDIKIYNFNNHEVKLKPNYHLVTPRIDIINEIQQGAKRTWTQARNYLYHYVLELEKSQGWKYAYLTFLDGDVRFDCPYFSNYKYQNLTTYPFPFLQTFYRFIHIAQLVSPESPLPDEEICLLAYDSFLLISSPAIGVVSNGFQPPIYDLSFQVVYHVDAMFNSFQHDAAHLLLPYCEYWDSYSWWTSQAFLIFRSVCVYGHAIQMNSIFSSESTHYPYPRNYGFAPLDDETCFHLNIFPRHLFTVHQNSGTARVLMALDINAYSGWSIKYSSKECRETTFVNATTCERVPGGKPLP